MVWGQRLPADRLTWGVGRYSCTVAPGRGTVPSSLSEHWGGLIFLSLCLLNGFLFDFTFGRFHMSFLEPKEDYLLTHTPIFWHTSPFWFELPRFWSVNYTLHCFHRDTPRDKISRCHFNQRTSEKSNVPDYLGITFITNPMALCVVLVWKIHHHLSGSMNAKYKIGRMHWNKNKSVKLLVIRFCEPPTCPKKIQKLLTFHLP